LRGEFSAENEREVFCGLVVDRLCDEVGEGHGRAAAKSVMRVLTRELKVDKDKASPTE
jgi:hypothetical protein